MNFIYWYPFLYCYFFYNFHLQFFFKILQPFSIFVNNFSLTKFEKTIFSHFELFQLILMHNPAFSIYFLFFSILFNFFLFFAHFFIFYFLLFLRFFISFYFYFLLLLKFFVFLNNIFCFVYNIIVRLIIVERRILIDAFIVY